MIGSASLNDDEYDLIEQTSQSYTSALYAEVMLVLDSREAVSNTRDRLTHYFQARGVAVVAAAVGKSEIYLGGDLCN